MGYNRSGTRRKQRLRRRAKEENRLAQKAGQEGAPTTKGKEAAPLKQAGPSGTTGGVS